MDQGIFCTRERSFLEGEYVTDARVNIDGAISICSGVVPDVVFGSRSDGRVSHGGLSGRCVSQSEPVHLCQTGRVSADSQSKAGSVGRARRENRSPSGSQTSCSPCFHLHAQLSPKPFWTGLGTSCRGVVLRRRCDDVLRRNGSNRLQSSNSRGTASGWIGCGGPC